MSFIYAAARDLMLNGKLAFLDDDITPMLVDVSYEPDRMEDSKTSDIPQAARIAVGNVLAGKTAKDGVARAADMTFGGVDSSSPDAMVGGLVLARGKDLVCYIDEVAAGPFPFKPNGGEVTVHVDSGPNGLFRL